MEEAAAPENNVPSSLVVPMIMGARAMLPSRNNSIGDLGKFRPSVTGPQRKPPPLVPLLAMKSCAFVARRQERTVAGSVQPYRVASATPAPSACGRPWAVRRAAPTARPLGLRKSLDDPASAALGDGPMKQSTARRRHDLQAHARASRRFAEDRDVVRVARERSDVALYPFERSALVFDAIVARYA